MLHIKPNAQMQAMVFHKFYINSIKFTKNFVPIKQLRKLKRFYFFQQTLNKISLKYNRNLYGRYIVNFEHFGK